MVQCLRFLVAAKAGRIAAPQDSATTAKAGAPLSLEPAKKPSFVRQAAAHDLGGSSSSASPR